MARWPICDLCGEEHDGGGCEGCDRDVCPDCLARFDDPIHRRYVVACKVCAADPAKMRELTEHLTPEYIAEIEGERHSGVRKE
jgi:hypothetical protein